MRRSYLITGAVFLLLAVFIAVEALKLQYYTRLGPGPGFFSFWLAVILGALALIMMLQATFGQPEPMPKDFFSNRIGYLRIGGVVLSLVFAIALLEPLGFSLTMFVVCAFMLYALGRQRIIFILLVSIAFSFGTYYVFDHWLQVALPRGVLGF